MGCEIRRLLHTYQTFPEFATVFLRHSTTHLHPWSLVVRYRGSLEAVVASGSGLSSPSVDKGPISSTDPNSSAEQQPVHTATPRGSGSARDSTSQPRGSASAAAVGSTSLLEGSRPPVAVGLTSDGSGAPRASPLGRPTAPAAGGGVQPLGAAAGPNAPDPPPPFLPRPPSHGAAAASAAGGGEQQPAEPRNDDEALVVSSATPLAVARPISFAAMLPSAEGGVTRIPYEEILGPSGQVCHTSTPPPPATAATAARCSRASLL